MLKNFFLAGKLNNCKLKYDIIKLDNKLNEMQLKQQDIYDFFSKTLELSSEINKFKREKNIPFENIEFGEMVNTFLDYFENLSKESISIYKTEIDSLNTKISSKYTDYCIINIKQDFADVLEDCHKDAFVNDFTHKFLIAWASGTKLIFNFFGVTSIPNGFIENVLDLACLKIDNFTQNWIIGIIQFENDTNDKHFENMFIGAIKSRLK